MSETGRFAVFFSVALTIWALLHVYVGHRLWRLPWLGSPAGHRAIVVAGVLLWLAYPVGRALDHLGWRRSGWLLELFGAQWMGLLFLLVSALLAADLVTGFGLWTKAATPARLLGAGLAVVLAVIATAQAARGPVVRRAEVRLAGLPAEAAGLRLAVLSDLHLGPLLGPRWLAARVDQVLAERADVVAIAGDLVDSDSRHMEEMLPELRRLRAPLGVLAVSGNHEFYAGLEHSLALMDRAGFTVLRDRAVEVRPGLVVAGVDDLTARRQFGLGGDPLAVALDGRPPGAAILLSHTPWMAEDAAARGVGLMISGHTHDGQIWPFNYLVRLQYPLLGGLHQVGAMHALVSRGTGTWGPRMRLWHPSEIWVLTLLPASS